MEKNVWGLLFNSLINDETCNKLQSCEGQFKLSYIWEFLKCCSEFINKGKTVLSVVE